MSTLKMLVGAALAFALLSTSAMADTIDPGLNPGITQTVNPLHPPFPFHPPPPPPPGPPTVVSVGDSAISGEAGRWAGNTNGLFVSTDALGPIAYNDNATGTAETIPGCHRSSSAEVHIGGGVTSVNLACSGAKTSTYVEPSTGNFKPGLDFKDIPGVGKGQALMLQDYAAAHPNSIKAVVVLIGANDYNWLDVAATCVKDWAFGQPPLSFLLGSQSAYCQGDASLQAHFSPANINAQTIALRDAFANVHQAMYNAGYKDDSKYKIIVQTYASEIPFGGGFRYPEAGLGRQTTGGCGIYDIDASWVDGFVVPIINHTIRNAAGAVPGLGLPGGGNNLDVLDATNALAGHRLCEKGVGTLEETGVQNWHDPRAADASEWVQRIRTPSFGFPIDLYVPPITPPYQYQENAHPNYWGQLALRNCFRQAYNNGSPHGGTCTFSGVLGLNATGEPNMILR